MRKVARKVQRLELRWARITYRERVPMAHAARLAGRIARLEARRGNADAAKTWGLIGRVLR